MAFLSQWSPKLVLSLKGYTPRKFFSDSVAGITVGLVALPLAMAFAIASGMSPQAGLYTGVLAGFLISLLGGSSTQIGGPTGAFVVVVAGTISPMATTVSVIGLAIILLTMRYIKRVPRYILALLVGTGITVILKLPIETIGSRFGGIPSGLPHFQIPHLQVALIRPLIPSAITIAMLGAIESL